MAARRITKSAIDWVAFAERVPENQVQLFQAFKAKSDVYLRKALELPENPPAINWGHYKSRISPSLVDQFQKQYTELKIKYPTENVSGEIAAQQEEAAKNHAEFVKESNVRIENHKKELVKWDNIVPFDQMTMEEYAIYFPEYAFDPLNRPTVWPHDGEDSHMVPRDPNKTES